MLMNQRNITVLANRGTRGNPIYFEILFEIICTFLSIFIQTSNRIFFLSLRLYIICYAARMNATLRCPRLYVNTLSCGICLENRLLEFFANNLENKIL